jgi:iron complex transport system substrate-binding protein
VILLALICWGGNAQGASFTDELGRNVRVPERIERIVSLAPSITEIVFALGSGDRLVGVTRFSDYPPETSTIQKVGSYVNPDIEKIVALRPDLVLGTKDGNPKALVERLARLGVPTYVVNPRTLEEVVSTVRRLGQLIDAGPAASDLAGAMAERIRRVQRKVAGSPRPRVFFQIGVEPIVSAGRGTFIDVLIRMAGGVNVTGQMSAYPHLSVERVLVARPEIIFVSSMARGRAFEKVKGFWEQWPGLPAVQGGRIHIVDSDILDRPSPRIVDGLETLAQLIHPQVFK